LLGDEAVLAIGTQHRLQGHGIDDVGEHEHRKIFLGSLGHGLIIQIAEMECTVGFASTSLNDEPSQRTALLILECHTSVSCPFSQHCLLVQRSPTGDQSTNHDT